MFTAVEPNFVFRVKSFRVRSEYSPITTKRCSSRGPSKAILGGKTVIDCRTDSRGFASGPLARLEDGTNGKLETANTHQGKEWTKRARKPMRITPPYSSGGPARS